MDPALHIPLRHYTYRVEGVHCTKCIAKIRDLSRTKFNIEDLKFNLANKVLNLNASEAFSGEGFVQELQKLGYTAKDITNLQIKPATDYEKENKIFLTRLGVAGACAGNLMLFGFALYLGAEDTVYGKPLAWLSLAFYIPVLFYCAYPILHGSLNALVNLRPSVDLPIAMALIVGGLLSFKNLLFNNPNIYFDSLSALVFLLLCTRYLVFQIKNKYLTPLSLAEIWPSKQMMISKKGQTEFALKDISTIALSDHIQITKSGILPVDGVLLSDSAEFDTSFLTGESFPVTYKMYDRVSSGSKLISENAIISAQSTTESSRLHEIFNKLNSALTEKNDLVTFTDKAGQILTYVTLGVSFTFLFFYTGISFDDRLQRILALLATACPCAFAIATPLALSLGVKKLFHQDILVKNPDAFEKVNNTNLIVFDKTGTLTQSSLQVTQWRPKRPDQEQQNIIYALEKQSEHPIAKALLRDVHPNQYDINIQIQEQIGVGVTGKVGVDIYSLEKSTGQQGQVVFKKNNQDLLYINFSSQLQTDAKPTLKFLNLKQISSYLLSGDNQNFSKRVGHELGFKPEHILYDQTPESKAQFIDSLSKEKKNILYLGDGLNDSLAMAKSNLSISVNNSVEATFKASDVHFNKSGISKIIPLFLVSKQVSSTIKRNLILSLIYNLVFGTLALSGAIIPLFTAFVMPISSITVVGQTFYFLYLRKDKQTL